MTNLEFKLTLMSLGLSPKEAADIFGMKRSSIYDIMYGRCPVSKPVTEKIIDFANKVTDKAYDIIRAEEYDPATVNLSDDTPFERAISIKVISSFYD